MCLSLTSNANIEYRMEHKAARKPLVLETMSFYLLLFVALLLLFKDMERRSLEILIYVDRKKVKRIHVCLVENEKKEFSRSLIRITLKILTLMG